MDLKESGHVCHSRPNASLFWEPHTCYSMAVALLQVAVNNDIVLHNSKLEWVSVCVHVQTFPITCVKHFFKKI